MKTVVAAVIAFALVAAFLGIAVVASASSFLGIGGPPRTATATATAAGSTIPTAMLNLYQEGAATCNGLPWTVLAAIGTVESDNGQSTQPGVHTGANSAGAEGPMQFEPATFAAFAGPVPPGGTDPPTPYDAADAVFAAARFLCANGAKGGANLSTAVFAYNHSTTYVSQVLTLAQALGPAAAVPAGTRAGDAGAVAVEWALSQIGTPYVWGGEMPGVGFDCSGLVQAAYKVAGVTLPRVAQNQYDATTQLASTSPLAPGDLVFFGLGPGDIQHVGLFVGTDNGESIMVDAPSSGTDVRAEAFPSTVGAWFGSLQYVGATRP
jgi:cell wall-associated NlpC family hydrolase